MLTKNVSVKTTAEKLNQLYCLLRWTQKHIKSFGGNPDKVTIFGESAGAGCASYHVMSPLSTGLFHQAISHSGTFYSIGKLLEI